MRKLRPAWVTRPGVSRLSCGHFSPSFESWGCASGKQATSCWWQSSPAGKSSLESAFHPRLRGCGTVQKFLPSEPSWLPRATSSQSCWAAPAPLGASVAPSTQLGRGRGPVRGRPVCGRFVCGETRVCRGVEPPRGACPRPDGVPRTCRTATFDLLLRPWVWPRPRSRLLREVWACVPAGRPGARRGGPGRAGAACRACGQGDEGTCGARPSFLDSGSWAQGTARPHPSLPSLTPSTWPLCSELPKLALTG